MTPYRDRKEAGEFEPGAAAPSELDALNKDELLALARERGVSPANATMTKDELRAALGG